MQREEKSKSESSLKVNHLTFFCIEKLTQVRQHAACMKKFLSLTLQRCMQLPWWMTEEKAETVGCEENESGSAPAVIQPCQSAIAAFYTRGSTAEIGPLD